MDTNSNNPPNNKQCCLYLFKNNDFLTIINNSESFTIHEDSLSLFCLSMTSGTTENELLFAIAILAIDAEEPLFNSTKTFHATRKFYFRPFFYPSIYRKILFLAPHLLPKLLKFQQQHFQPELIPSPFINLSRYDQHYERDTKNHITESLTRQTIYTGNMPTLNETNNDETMLLERTTHISSLFLKLFKIFHPSNFTFKNEVDEMYYTHIYIDVVLYNSPILIPTDTLYIVDIFKKLNNGNYPNLYLKFNHFFDHQTLIDETNLKNIFTELFKIPELCIESFLQNNQLFLQYCDVPSMIKQHPDQFL